MPTDTVPFVGVCCGWFRGGSGVVPIWYRFGHGMVLFGFGFASDTSPAWLRFHVVWLLFRIILGGFVVFAWFRCGLGDVPASFRWISGVCFGVVPARLWRDFVFVFPVWFRFGSGLLAVCCPFASGLLLVCIQGGASAILMRFRRVSSVLPARCQCSFGLVSMWFWHYWLLRLLFFFSWRVSDVRFRYCRCFVSALMPLCFRFASALLPLCFRSVPALLPLCCRVASALIPL